MKLRGFMHHAHLPLHFPFLLTLSLQFVVPFLEQLILELIGGIWAILDVVMPLAVLVKALEYFAWACLPLCAPP